MLKPARRGSTLRLQRLAGRYTIEAVRPESGLNVPRKASLAFPAAL
jgi:hypothetical protein